MSGVEIRPRTRQRVREIPDGVLEYIKEQIETTPYGKVIIELNATAAGFSIMTETRQRFTDEGKPV